MPFTIEATAIPEVLIVRPRLFGDERGWFTEVLQVDAFAKLGVPNRSQAAARAWALLE